MQSATSRRPGRDACAPGNAIIDQAVDRFFENCRPAARPGMLDGMRLLDEIAMQGVHFDAVAVPVPEEPLHAGRCPERHSRPDIRMDLIIARQFLTRWAASFGLMYSPLGMRDVLTVGMERPAAAPPGRLLGLGSPIISDEYPETVYVDGTLDPPPATIHPANNRFARAPSVETTTHSLRAPERGFPQPWKVARWSTCQVCDLSAPWPVLILASAGFRATDFRFQIRSVHRIRIPGQPSYQPLSERHATPGRNAAANLALFRLRL